jgi:hypothetical protein
VQDKSSCSATWKCVVSIFAHALRDQSKKGVS